MSQQQKGFDLSMKDSFNIGYFLMQAQAACVTPFTRIGFGAEALGIHGIGAFILLCLWAMGTASFEFEYYMVLWFVAMLMQRTKTLIDGWRGNYQHSAYDGYPWLTAWMCRHESLARFLEGILVLVAGVAMEDIAWPIGPLLMTSGGCIIFLEGIHRQYHLKQAMVRRDAVIEMQQMGNPLTGKPQWQIRR